MASSTTVTESTAQIPLVVIIGPTGTGKSKLAIELAKHISRSRSGTQQSKPSLAAEIINADAMQMYEGLPIVTNKLSKEEQEGIPHHLLGGISLKDETWTINRFLIEADTCIEKIRSRARVPIVVGGTGYYVHGLLLGDATLRSDDKHEPESRGSARAEPNTSSDSMHTDIQSGNHNVDPEEMEQILNQSNEELLARLKEVDPVMAEKWHPNDRRKIQRSLQIWLKTGKRASDLYEAQLSKRKGTAILDADQQLPDSAAWFLRYSPLVFWLDTEDTILKERLNQRVDCMVEDGLLREVMSLAEYEQSMQRNGTPVAKDRGIWASIGYKEIVPWLKHVSNPQVSETDKTSIKLRDECLEAVKAGTRRYAKRQNRYIRGRLANALHDAGLSPQLFVLDTTNLNDWKSVVEQPAANIVDKYLNGIPLPEPSGLSKLAMATLSSIDVNKNYADRFVRRCEHCGTCHMTEAEWTHHNNSRSHKKVLQAAKKREFLQNLATTKPSEGGS